MSEARARKNDHFQSSIFSIQEPVTVISKNTFAHQKYNENSSIFNDSYQKQESKPLKKYSTFKPENLLSPGLNKNPSNDYPRPRTSNSQRSSIFNPSEPIEYKPNIYKPKDSIILGTDADDYSPKKQPVKVFEPNYEYTPANEKKQLELYGVVNPKPSSPEKRSISVDPKARKSQEMNSQIFGIEKDQKISENQRDGESKKEEINKKSVKRAYTPDIRKIEMSRSSIFGDEPSISQEKPSNEKKEDIVRRKNHLYSDIFGDPKVYKSIASPDKLKKGKNL